MPLDRDTIPDGPSVVIDHYARHQHAIAHGTVLLASLKDPVQIVRRGDLDYGAILGQTFR